MKAHGCLLFLLLLFEPGDAQVDEVGIILVNELLKLVRDVFRRLAVNGSQEMDVVDEQKWQTPVTDLTPFPCNVTAGQRSPVRPTSVSRLRPGDIDVVAAIGDGLTTANGALAADSIWMDREYRGLSFSMGGYGTWRDTLTLPNILKVFNPNLIGYYENPEDYPIDGAEGGTTIYDLPFLANMLVRRLKRDPRVDVERDWKLVTILLGNNDFCTHLCFMEEELFRESHLRMRRQLIFALNYLRDHLPRTIVNLVLPLVTDAFVIEEGLKGNCQSMHIMECGCRFGLLSSYSLDVNVAMQREWQDMEEEVALDPVYRRDDFLVIVQPFTKNISFASPENGTLDDTLLAVDCFHFSQKGHAAAANALWNNLLQPVGGKSESWTEPFEVFLCPTEERPFLATYDNSPGEDLELHTNYINYR